MAKATSSAPEFPEHNSNNKPATDAAPFPSGDLHAFSLDQFRISQEHFGDSASSKVLTTVPVNKPPKECYFRTHPGADYRLAVGIVELKATNEMYLVSGNLGPPLQDEPTFSLKQLVTTVTRDGSVYLWPVAADSANSWARSAYEAIAIATKRWIRLKSNRQIGAYEPIVAAANANIGDPSWPEHSFAELVKIAFRGRIIDTLDHAVLRQLRGE